MVFRVDQASGKVAGSATVGEDAKAIALTAGAQWVANVSDHTVAVIDVATMAVKRTVRVGQYPSAFASADGAMWVANQGAGTISRIDN